LREKAVWQQGDLKTPMKRPTEKLATVIIYINVNQEIPSNGGQGIEDGKEEDGEEPHHRRGQWGIETDVLRIERFPHSPSCPRHSN